MAGLPSLQLVAFCSFAVRGLAPVPRLKPLQPAPSTGFDVAVQASHSVMIIPIESQCQTSTASPAPICLPLAHPWSCPRPSSGRTTAEQRHCLYRSCRAGTMIGAQQKVRRAGSRQDRQAIGGQLELYSNECARRAKAQEGQVGRVPQLRTRTGQSPGDLACPGPRLRMATRRNRGTKSLGFRELLEETEPSRGSFGMSLVGAPPWLVG